MQIQVAGMPWFYEDDYETFRSLLPDRSWHDSYREWETAANERLQRVRDDGIRAVKAKVRSGDFADWCRRTGRNVDTQALLAFANEAAYRELTGEH